MFLFIRSINIFLIRSIFLLSLTAISFLVSAPLFAADTNKEKCPESFLQHWKLFRTSIEKDRMKDIKFLTHFPLTLTSADETQSKELTPSQFQNIFYKIMSEKCDVMDHKNQRQWILKYKELPQKSSFFTCTKKWAQFCNFDFSLKNSQWRLTKISTTQKNLFK